MQHVEAILRNVQIRLRLTQPHSSLKPADSTGILFFISVHNSDVVRRDGLAAAICALVPIHSCGRVSPNALARVIEIAKIDLARRVSRSCCGEKEPKRSP